MNEKLVYNIIRSWSTLHPNGPWLGLNKLREMLIKREVYDGDIRLFSTLKYLEDDLGWIHIDPGKDCLKAKELWMWGYTNNEKNEPCKHAFCPPGSDLLHCMEGMGTDDEFAEGLLCPVDRGLPCNRGSSINDRL